MSILDKVTGLFKEDPVEKRKREEDLHRRCELARRLAYINKEILLNAAPDVDLTLINGIGKALSMVNGTVDHFTGSYLVDVKTRVLFVPIWSSKRYRVIMSDHFETITGKYQSSSYIFISEIPSGSRNNEFIFLDGIYEGMVIDGQRQGFGYVKWKEGTVFEGQFNNGKVSGLGKITFPNGEKYSGEFGEIQYTNSNYVGQVDKHVVSDNKKHGRGRMSLSSGFVYIGDFINDLYDGSGTSIFSNQETYVGEFSGGKKTGRGTYLWANGEKYEGEWQNNQMHGNGTVYFANNKIKLQGKWEAGKFTG